MSQTNLNTRLILYILKCRPQCKITEVNWLEFGDVVRVSKIDHQFFSRRSGTNSREGLKQIFVNTVMQE